MTEVETRKWLDGKDGSWPVFSPEFRLNVTIIYEHDDTPIEVSLIYLPLMHCLRACSAVFMRSTGRLYVITNCGTCLSLPFVFTAPAARAQKRMTLSLRGPSLHATRGCGVIRESRLDPADWHPLRFPLKTLQDVPQFHTGTRRVPFHQDAVRQVAVLLLHLFCWEMHLCQVFILYTVWDSRSHGKQKRQSRFYSFPSVPWFLRAIYNQNCYNQTNYFSTIREFVYSYTIAPSIS